MITNDWSALPPWAVGIVTVLVVINLCLPKVLRALDDRRIAKKASEKINSEQGALEALRIRSSPRPIIGRLFGTSTPTSTPDSARIAQADEGAARETPESEPHDQTSDRQPG